MKLQFRLLKQLFDAMAFANAGNFSEFQKLLDNGAGRQGERVLRQSPAQMLSLCTREADAEFMQILHKKSALSGQMSLTDK